MRKLLDKLLKNKGFIIFMIIFVSMRWSFADHYRVPSGSMMPTIHIGDDVFVNKMAYDLKLPFTDKTLINIKSPKKGEIIVFKYPKDPSILFVKRLVALPGDRVEIVDGFVKVNGKSLLKEPNMEHNLKDKLYFDDKVVHYTETINGKEYQVQRIPSYFRAHSLSFTVPKNQYFFMGDNRDNSSDGRVWGFVPRSFLKGSVKRVTYSISFENYVPKINLSRFGKPLI